LQNNYSSEIKKIV